MRTSFVRTYPYYGGDSTIISFGVSLVIICIWIIMWNRPGAHYIYLCYTRSFSYDSPCDYVTENYCCIQLILDTSYCFSCKTPWTIRWYKICVLFISFDIKCSLPHAPLLFGDMCYQNRKHQDYDTYIMAIKHVQLELGWIEVHHPIPSNNDTRTINFIFSLPAMAIQER